MPTVSPAAVPSNDFFLQFVCVSTNSVRRGWTRQLAAPPDPTHPAPPTPRLPQIFQGRAAYGRVERRTGQWRKCLPCPWNQPVRTLTDAHNGRLPSVRATANFTSPPPPNSLTPAHSLSAPAALHHPPLQIPPFFFFFFLAS